MNRLAAATSPYLLQHAGNPVDWYPWGPEALDLARRLDRPILLSIGYAACHWCHVMEHESFEDEATARLMNTLFVNIKVDREERPDLDSVYMRAVQAMTGHGGWPMTVFLTSDGVPFHGGTYFPPEDRHGLPGFPRVLRAVAAAWRDEREQVLHAGEQMRRMLERDLRPATGDGGLEPTQFAEAVRRLSSQFDDRFGGFGGAPKFPPLMTLEFLLLVSSRSGNPACLDMARRTFLAIANGGVHDQVGGGIHRYSVDERWQVPHFEKMLYDNALFIRTGVHLWQTTGDHRVRTVTEQAIEWVTREMTDPGGGFHSSLDADSEGHEGRFYVWQREDVIRLLGDNAEAAILVWGITEPGFFEGACILHERRPRAEVAAALGISEDDLGARVQTVRAVLYEARARRPWPAKDDKVVAAWNGLMLRALAEAAFAFDRADILALAWRNAKFVTDHLVQDGRVCRSWRGGTASAVGFLEDQAAVGLGLLEFFGVTGDESWFTHARNIAVRAVADFCGPDGAVHDTPHDHESLVARPSDPYDNATPSGAALLAELLLRLEILGRDAELGRLGRTLLMRHAAGMPDHPMAFPFWWCVADLAVYGPVEIRARGPLWPPSEFTQVLRTRFLPSRVLDPRPIPGDGPPAIQVCADYVCHDLATTAEALSVQLTFEP